jgi:hypothetical protein
MLLCSGNKVIEGTWDHDYFANYSGRGRRAAGCLDLYVGGENICRAAQRTAGAHGLSFRGEFSIL